MKLARLCSMAVLAALVLLMLPGITLASAAMPSDGADAVAGGVASVIDGIDWRPLDEALRDTPLVEGGSASELVRKLAQGEAVLDADGMVRLLGSLLGREATDSMQLMLRIVVLAALGGIMHQMRGAFGSGSVSAAGRFTVLLLCLAPMTLDLSQLIDAGGGAVRRMAALTQNVSPALLTLLAAVGGGATAAAFQPALAGATGFAVTLIAGFIMPCLLSSAALLAVDALGEKPKLERLVMLLRSACHWMLGAAFTALLAVTAMQGAMAASYDGISLRTAKFAVDRLVPVVGGMFADSMDVLVGCTVLVKNGFGVVGVIALLSYALMPVLRIAAAVGCYRLAAAVLEPVADPSLLRCLSNFAAILTTLLVAVISAAAIFVITVAMLGSAGGTIAMIR